LENRWDTVVEIKLFCFFWFGAQKQLSILWWVLKLLFLQETSSAGGSVKMGYPAESLVVKPSLGT
jgi:hypothetical protein